jgi:bacteriorhodopsin
LFCINNITNFYPHWVWYTCGSVGSLAVLGYIWLQFRSVRKTQAEKHQLTDEGSREPGQPISSKAYLE